MVYHRWPIEDNCLMMTLLHIRVLNIIYGMFQIRLSILNDNGLSLNYDWQGHVVFVSCFMQGSQLFLAKKFQVISRF